MKKTEEHTIITSHRNDDHAWIRWLNPSVVYLSFVVSDLISYPVKTAYIINQNTAETSQAKVELVLISLSGLQFVLTT